MSIEISDDDDRSIEFVEVIWCHNQYKLYLRCYYLWKIGPKYVDSDINNVTIITQQKTSQILIIFWMTFRFLEFQNRRLVSRTKWPYNTKKLLSIGVRSTKLFAHSTIFCKYPICGFRCSDATQVLVDFPTLGGHHIWNQTQTWYLAIQNSSNWQWCKNGACGKMAGDNSE